VLLHFAISWQAQHFVMWQRCCSAESQWHGCANLTRCQKMPKVMAGAAYCEALENSRKRRKNVKKL